MKHVLLVGGQRGGEVVQWPREDDQACRFVINLISRTSFEKGSAYPPHISTTPPYFLHNVLGFLVATNVMFLYPNDMALCAIALVMQPIDQLKKIQIDLPEMEASNG